MTDQSENLANGPQSDSLELPLNEDVDLSAESVITIQRDGRVHLFGITPAAVAVLASIPCADAATKQRLGRMLRAARDSQQEAAASPSQKEVS